MKRFALLLSCGLLLAGSGCCLWHQQPYCGQACPPMYGGGAACPGGACPPSYGPGFPAGQYYGPGASAALPSGYQTTAMSPYGYQTAATMPYGYQTAAVNYLPAY